MTHNHRDGRAQVSWGARRLSVDLPLQAHAAGVLLAHGGLAILLLELGLQLVLLLPAMQ